MSSTHSKLECTIGWVETQVLFSPSYYSKYASGRVIVVCNAIFRLILCCYQIVKLSETVPKFDVLGSQTFLYLSHHQICGKHWWSAKQPLRSGSKKSKRRLRGKKYRWLNSNVNRLDWAYIMQVQLSAVVNMIMNDVTYCMQEFVATTINILSQLNSRLSVKFWQRWAEKHGSKLVGQLRRTYRMYATHTKPHTVLHTTCHCQTHQWCTKPMILSSVHS